MKDKLVRKPLGSFFGRLFSTDASPAWLVLGFDVMVVILSPLVIMAMNYGIEGVLRIFGSVLVADVMYLPLFLLNFRLFHTYSNIVRYSSFADLWAIAKAMFYSVLIVALASHVIESELGFYQLPLSVILESVILASCIMSLSRLSVKFLYEMFATERKCHKVMIYGAKSGGVSLAKGLKSDAGSGYRLVGFIVNDAEYVKKSYVMGSRIYAKSDNIPALMKKLGADTLLVSPMKIDDIRNDRGFVDSLIKAGIRIKIHQYSSDWDGKSELNASSLKDVEVEDLLPRQQISVDMDAIGRQLSGQVILITGAAGSIGSEMVRQVAQFKPKRLVLVDQAETPMHDIRLMMAEKWPDVECLTVVSSITCSDCMESLFREHRPVYVFHAAAYKHVPMMEDNPGVAILNNCLGTHILADLAVKYGTRKFVMISTDKAVNPTNVMGCSKRICEIYVQSLNNDLKRRFEAGELTVPPTQFVTTRFGNVLGSNGSVIPRFRDQIRAGGPVTVTHPNIIRFFMLIPEACRLVLEAGTMGNGGEIFVFDMGEPVRIADLAQRMIDLSGASNVQIQYTGLRAGEKLYEEVLNDSETTTATPHPKIMVAKVREYTFEEVLQKENHLIELAYSFNDMKIVQAMKELVPEFKSQNSKYQVLD